MENNPLLLSIYSALTFIALAKAAVLCAIVGFKLLTRVQSTSVIFGKSLLIAVSGLIGVVLFEYGGALAALTTVFNSHNTMGEVNLWGLLRVAVYAVGTFMLFYLFDRIFVRQELNMTIDCVGIVITTIFSSLVGIMSYSYYHYGVHSLVFSDVIISFLIGGLLYFALRLIVYRPMDGLRIKLGLLEPPYSRSDG